MCWQWHRRKGKVELRPYVEGEDMNGISVSQTDRAAGLSGGYIARNPDDPQDQWYLAKAYFDTQYEPVS